MAGQPRKPRIRARRIIERPRLIRALDRSDARVRTLVAPSGYGKTTLAEQWASTDGRVAAWYRARRSAADVSVVAGRTVSLDGVGSSDVDGDALSFSWALIQRPAGSGAVLGSASNAITSLSFSQRPGPASLE